MSLDTFHLALACLFVVMGFLFLCMFSYFTCWSFFNKRYRKKYIKRQALEIAKLRTKFEDPCQMFKAIPAPPSQVSPGVNQQLSAITESKALGFSTTEKKKKKNRYIEEVAAEDTAQETAVQISIVDYKTVCAEKLIQN